MTFETWIVFVMTVLVLMITPGPSQLLMLSNSARHGFVRSMATAAGDLAANVLQMLVAAVGLAAVLTASTHALTVIKWLGVLYLLWLGIRMIRQSGSVTCRSTDSGLRESAVNLWLQGFLTSAANPKAVVFFAALFPQFIDAHASFWLQFGVFALTYVVLDAAFLFTYAGAASGIAKRFNPIPMAAWVADPIRITSVTSAKS